MSTELRNYSARIRIIQQNIVFNRHKTGKINKTACLIGKNRDKSTEHRV